jgi:hypothetical protein
MIRLISYDWETNRYREASLPEDGWGRGGTSVEVN